MQLNSCLTTNVERCQFNDKPKNNWVTCEKNSTGYTSSLKCPSWTTSACEHSTVQIYTVQAGNHDHERRQISSEKNHKQMLIAV